MTGNSPCHQKIIDTSSHNENPSPVANTIGPNTNMTGSTASESSTEAATMSKGGMTDEQLDKHMSEFEKLEKHLPVDKPRNQSEDFELRQCFQRWYAVYRVIIGRIEEMRRMFIQFEEKYKKCKKPDEKNDLAQKIIRRNDQLRERKKRLEKNLTALHAMLKSMKKALGE